MVATKLIRYEPVTISYVGNTDEIARLTAQLQELREAKATLTTAQRIAHFGRWEWNTRSGEVTGSEEVYRIFGLDPEVFRPQIEYKRLGYRSIFSDVIKYCCGCEVDCS